MKILIVDDSPEARFCLKEQLESGGHRVIAEAEDLKGALKAYGEARPDAVMLDLTLEREDGLTVLRELRKLDPAAKVIIISANEMARIKREAFELGASGYLVKPVDEPELLALLSDQ